jgi:hypothetical protein
MGIEMFYTFSSKLSSLTVQAHAISLSSYKEDINGQSEQHKLIKGDFKGINFPVIFEQQYGKKFEDILDTGWPGLFLRQERKRNKRLSWFFYNWSRWCYRL